MNSMSVTWSTSRFERLLLAPKNPSTLTELPSGLPASSLACVPNATALTSASTALRPPASSCSDWCASLNSTAAMPAGV
jgi:hypothetical protein